MIPCWLLLTHKHSHSPQSSYSVLIRGMQVFLWGAGEGRQRATGVSMDQHVTEMEMEKHEVKGGKGLDGGRVDILIELGFTLPSLLRV